MCGIAGVITASKNFHVASLLNEAATMQSHRGPDASSISVENDGLWEVGFAHQRLAVLDLSESGVQPMESLHGKSSIIYNGEVYNYRDIRKDLAAQKYLSSTDTEVVLNALEEKGIFAASNLFNGMWAFAWHDKANSKLFLCRDRIGIKPLYYYKNERGFYFSSEIKTILATSKDEFDLNYQAVGEYLCQALQNTSTSTMYAGIYSVAPGHYLEIDLSENEIRPIEKCYWSVSNALPYEGDDVVGDVRKIFYDSVRLRMISDVPIGVTLSGGLDSSAIAGAMKDHLGGVGNLNILSVVSPGSDLDESPFIDIMCDYLGAKAEKVTLDWSPDEAVALLRDVTWHNDTPVGSFSNVAHYLMMKKANDLGITVILSGQGADELLCGYKKYLGFYVQSLLRRMRFLKAVGTIAGFLINRSIISQFSFMEAKRYLPNFLTGSAPDISGIQLKKCYSPVALSLKPKQTIEQRQIEDLEKYSVPFLTQYEDRMSMAWSREIRLPFLDYRLIELLAHLPADEKLFKGWTKYVFRKAMQDRIPDSIVWRKDKQGFVSPQEQWLKHELKEEVCAVFSKDALIFSMGLVDREVLMDKYEHFCMQKQGKGKVWYREIFAPFALELWLQVNKQYIKSNELH